jgi:predicted Zn-ribbon and HTH transcriptional regulator
MYSDIKLKEFEWYLRDLFFRTTSNNKNMDILVNFKRDEISSSLRKYLRYKNTDIEEISNLLEIVLNKLQKDNVLTIDNKNIKIDSKLKRKQCSNCFYINYLSINEPIQCSRCNSQDLHDFPKRK